MSEDKFMQTMLERLQRRPFVPFDVEMVDGRIVPVDAPYALNAGMIVFLNQDGVLIDLSCEEVNEIRPLAPEPVR